MRMVKKLLKEHYEKLKKKNGKIIEVAEVAQIGVRQIHKLLSKYDMAGTEYRTSKADIKGLNSRETMN